MSTVSTDLRRNAARWCGHELFFQRLAAAVGLRLVATVSELAVALQTFRLRFGDGRLPRIGVLPRGTPRALSGACNGVLPSLSLSYWPMLAGWSVRGWLSRRARFEARPGPTVG